MASFLYGEFRILCYFYDVEVWVQTGGLSALSIMTGCFAVQAWLVKLVVYAFSSIYTYSTNNLWSNSFRTQNDLLSPFIMVTCVYTFNSPIMIHLHTCQWFLVFPPASANKLQSNFFSNIPNFCITYKRWLSEL